MQAELLVKMRAVTGEGPVWDEREQVLYWVDIPSKLIMRYHPHTGENQVRPMDKMVGAVALCRSGGLVAAMEGDICRVDFETGAAQTLYTVEDRADNRFNDAKCDPRGDFWAGTMSRVGKRGQGTLYRAFADGSGYEAIIPGVGVSNGMAWSPDERTFYYTDTVTREIWAYDYDGITGKIDNRRVAVRVAAGEGGPDGFTIDAEGMLWVAQWGGWRVCRYNPATGEKLVEIMLPAQCVSCCVFGGENLDELYITTATENFTAEQLEQQPLAGSLFRVKTHVRGLPSYRFAQ
ncbi:MAG: SMP-30/gluconolactonase/LRE family protein [Eubacteriales bacterium]|nr:SMP-30/gluconolactonase/LRE family protein [Eubacteriales bacterium]